MGNTKAALLISDGLASAVMNKCLWFTAAFIHLSRSIPFFL